MASTKVLERHTHPKYERLTVQLRSNSKFYQAVTYLDGKLAQKSVKTDRLPTALKLGEDWYKRLLRSSVEVGRKHPIDRLATDPTISELYTAYRQTLPPTKKAYAAMKWSTIEDFWRTLVVTEINTKTFRDFYAWRRKRKTPQKTTIKNHSLHKDVMVIRQILKYAIEEEHIEALPLIPKVGKIAANPRPWFDRDEFDTLVGISQMRIIAAKGNAKLKQQRQDLDDFIFFLMESLARVNELRDLTVGQCRVIKKKGSDPYLMIDLRGKTSHRTTSAGGLAPEIYQRRAKGLKASDRLWPHGQRDACRELLIAAELRTDAFGMTRNLKSVRATAISFKILAQAPTPNLLLIARMAGTSVNVIDKFYAQKLSAELLGAGGMSGSNVI